MKVSLTQPEVYHQWCAVIDNHTALIHYIAVTDVDMKTPVDGVFMENV